MYAHVSVCTYLDTYAYVHIYDRMGGLAGDAERSTWVYLMNANEGRLARHHGLCSTVYKQPRRYEE